MEIHRYDKGANVVGVLPGATRPDEWMVVGAHYDTVPTTVHGTWDNGAGVGAVLEVARVAAQRPWDRTLAVVFFDDEEVGLVGSERFVAAYDGKPWRGGAPVRFVAAITLDPPGLNYPCVGTVNDASVHLPFTYFQQNDLGEGGSLLRAFVEAAAADAGVPASAMENAGGSIAVVRALFLGLSGESDNAPFGRQGVADVWIGGSAHVRASAIGTEAMTYPLHTPADNPSTLFARCPGTDPVTGRLLLAQGFEVAVKATLGTLTRVDDYGSAFPRP